MHQGKALFKTPGIQSSVEQGVPAHWTCPTCASLPLVLVLVLATIVVTMALVLVVLELVFAAMSATVPMMPMTAMMTTQHGGCRAKHSTLQFLGHSGYAAETGNTLDSD